MQNGRSIEELNIGDRAEFSKTISETDSYLYAGITGDFNPIHINKSYSEKTMYGERLVHGFLTAGFISSVIGVELPGPGTIYLEQNMKFLKPVMVNETITARVTVTSKDINKNRVELQTECLNEQNEIVLTGQAIVIPPVKIDV